MARRIFILNGHPRQRSLSGTFARAYADAAQASGHEVKVMNLSELAFDPDFGEARFVDHKPLEPDLEAVMQAIEWSDHVVLTAPMWWGGLPAKLKGLFDRSLLPGRAFDTRTSKLPVPLLKGRSARVILTSDTPGWYFRLVYHRALHWQLKKQIFGFVGLTPTRFTHFAQSSHATDSRVSKWVDAVRGLGAQAA